MFAGIYKSTITLGIVIVFYTFDSLLIAQFDKERQAEGSGRSWSYTFMILGMVGFVIIQPLFLPWLSLHVEAQWGLWVQVTGLLLVIEGLALHGWARIHLKHFYAERVELQPNHYIIESGPYAYVRHPIFTSFFLLVGGLLLINPSLPTAWVALYTLWDFARAAKQEEALLSKHVAGYTEYMTRTNRFLPKLMPRTN